MRMGNSVKKRALKVIRSPARKYKEAEKALLKVAELADVFAADLERGGANNNNHELWLRTIKKGLDLALHYHQAARKGKC